MTLTRVGSSVKPSSSVFGTAGGALSWSAVRRPEVGSVSGPGVPGFEDGKRLFGVAAVGSADSVGKSGPLYPQDLLRSMV